MLVYRVVPFLSKAKPGTPGHPMYLPANQGAGRWDNPDHYLTMYVATSPEAAIGETFAAHAVWTREVLIPPRLNGAVRRLGIYETSAGGHPPLDLDDAAMLLERSVRPSQVVIRDRERTQQIALDAFLEGRWSGVKWWSMHWPEWVLQALWEHDIVKLVEVQDVPGEHAHRAAETLARTYEL